MSSSSIFQVWVFHGGVTVELINHLSIVVGTTCGFKDYLPSGSDMHMLLLENDVDSRDSRRRQ